MQRKTDHPLDADPIGWPALFGHGAEKGGYWPKLRATQLAAIRRGGLARTALNFFAIGGTVLVWPHPVAPGLQAWCLLIASIALLDLFGARSAQGKSISSIRDQLRAQTRRAGLTGLAWALLPALFAPLLPPAGQIGLAALLLALAIGMSLTFAAVPLAVLAFVTLAGSGLVLMLAGQGLALPAWATLGLMAGLALASLANARSLLLRHLAEAALVDKEDVVRMLLREHDAGGGDWIWQTDATRCLVGVSDRLAAVLGQPVAVLEGKPLLQVLSGAGWDGGALPSSLHDLAEKLRQRDTIAGLMLPVDIGGETRWWQLSATPRFDAQGGFAGYRGVGSDVTEAHRSVDRISRMARFDPLTSLPNRAYLMESLDRGIAAAAAERGRCALLLIDLDRFKTVNDTLGHPVGDKLLVQVADRLRSLVPDRNLCGRLGGDEFAVVVRNADDPAALQHLARQIIASLSEPYEIDRARLVIGASIGSASSPRDGRTTETLLRAADLALYQSKHEGRGTAIAYQPRFEADAEERRMLEIALQGALERGELAVTYQPVWDVLRTHITGFEALLRWKRPDGQWLTASQFLSIARETRLIVPIGAWVVQSVCAAAADWPDPIRVRINIAGEQLADAGFVASIMMALSKSGLAAQRLTLDIGEEALRIAGPGGEQVLAKLKALGVNLTLGEFGIGPSALSHLSEARFSGVAVHPALIHQSARQDRESMARLRAITTLAQSLGLTATIVGVESEAQLALAQSCGASHVQGFLLGSPLHAGEVQRLLQQADPARAVA